MTHVATDDEVLVECDLDASPEKVWRALTVPALAERWLALGEYPESATYEVIEALPHSRVRYAWNDPAADKRESIVTFDLEPLPEGRTRFRLTHAVEARKPRLAANANWPPVMARAA